MNIWNLFNILYKIITYAEFKFFLFKYFWICSTVISSNIGSLPELVIDGENGYLFTPGDVDELLLKIKNMDNDDLVKKMGKKSLEILNKKFSKENHYSQLLKVFNNAIKERK